jgi:hypothetical protein
LALVINAAQALDRATGAAAFTRLGAGGRAIAMGRAYTAVCDGDPFAVFWNPAGVARGTAEPMRLGATERLFADADFGMGGPASFVSAAGAARLTTHLGAGLGVMYYGVQGIEQYDPQAVYMGDFTDGEMLIVASLARVQAPLSVGLSLKYLRQGYSGLTGNVGANSAGGIGFDAGIMARFWSPVIIGVVVRNEVEMGRDVVPAMATVGAAYERPLHLGRLTPRLVGGLDLEQVDERPIRVHLGAELDSLAVVRDIVLALRCGTGNRFLEQRLGRLLTQDYRDQLGDADLGAANRAWGLGLGVTRGRVGIDYTVTTGRLQDPHYVSVSYTQPLPAR